MDELRHRQPLLHHCRRPVGIHQRRARKFLGALQSGNQSAGHPPEGRDSGGGKRCHRDRDGEPERKRRSGEIFRGLGHERHLRRVYALDVHARPRLEPAESGQPVSHGRAAHSRRACRTGNRRRCAHALRHFLDASVEALSARASDPLEFLGLQRCGPGLLRGRGNRRTRAQGGNYLN